MTSSLSSELSELYDSDEGENYNAKPERSTRRNRVSQAYDDEEDEEEEEEEEEEDWDDSGRVPAGSSLRSTRGRVVESSRSVSVDDADEDAFDDQDDEEEIMAAPPPTKRSIKLVVSNPKPPVSPAKKSTRRKAATQYDEDDEEDAGLEEDGAMLEDEEEVNDNGFEEEEEEDEFEDEFDEGALKQFGTDSQDHSRLGTPDFSKMTARQRARFDGDEGPLLELPAEPSKKKTQLTEEEQQLKRAEMARRRKNMSVRRLEEEKQDTLDKLLKKRASRSRKIIVDTNDGGPGTPIGGPGTPTVMGEDGKYKVAKSRLVPRHPSLLSWISNRGGFTLSMESEWLDIPNRS